MSDLSKISDEELKALYAQSQQKRMDAAGMKPYSAADVPWYENLQAGFGKALMDMGRGAGNIVTDVAPGAEKLGFATRADTDATKKRDAALMDTGSGVIGNVIGNVLPAIALPASSIPRALLSGMALGGAQPVGTKDSRMENMAESGMFSAAVPAAAGAYKVARAVAEPVMAPQRTAARVLEQFADDPAALRTAAASEIVPNSKPTLSQVLQQPGIASLERGMLNQPGPLQKAMTDRLAEQNAARAAQLKDLSGADGRLDFYKANRQTAADELYKKAFAEVPEDSKYIKGEITKLIQRPSFVDALKEAQTLAMDQGIKVSPKNPENTTQLLHFTKMALDDKIEQAMRAGNGNKSKALIDTRDKLVSLMESKGFSPSYREARDTYKNMSGPINEMEIAGDLYAKAAPALQDITGAVPTRLKQDALAAEVRRRFPEIEKTFAPESRAKLDAVLQDMQRAAKAEGMGKPLGSPTAQYLTTQNLMRNVMGPLGLPASFAEKSASMLQAAPVLGSAVNWAGKGAEQRVQQELAQMLMDPATASQALAIINKQPGRLGRKMQPMLPYMPSGAAGLGGSGMFSYLSQ
jgi:hypothetical protein